MDIYASAKGDAVMNDTKLIINKLYYYSLENKKYSWEGKPILANRAYAQYLKQVKLLEKINGDELENILEEMMADEDEYMQFCGMVLALSFGLCREKAKEILRKQLEYYYDTELKDKTKVRTGFSSYYIKFNIDNTGTNKLYQKQQRVGVYEKGWFDE